MDAGAQRDRGDVVQAEEVNRCPRSRGGQDLEGKGGSIVQGEHWFCRGERAEGGFVANPPHWDGTLHKVKENSTM